MRAFILAGLLAFFPSYLRAEEALTFLVNQANGISELTEDQVADFYFKRKIRWPNGSKVQFIDQKDGNARKVLFLKMIGQNQRTIDLFWIGEKNFTGTSAPLQAPSDSMVISMVATLPGAIGYISGSRTDLGKTKAILVKKTE